MTWRKTIEIVVTWAVLCGLSWVFWWQVARAIDLHK